MSAHKNRIAEAFSQSVERYDQGTDIQAEVAKRVASQAVSLCTVNSDVLEVGCGTGGVTRHVLHGCEGGRFLITDIAPAMVEMCRASCRDPRAQFLVMDGEHPALLAGQNFDVIVSSLALQWFGDLAAGVEALARHLKPQGHMVFSTLGARTFHTWRSAHEALGFSPGTPNYPSETELITALTQLGLQCELKSEIIEKRYDNAQAFARRLKVIGANTPRANRAPLTPKQFHRLSARLGENFADSYHIFYACVKKSPK